MVDLDGVGGIPVVMKELLAAGLLHGDVLTCTGQTLAGACPFFSPKSKRIGFSDGKRRGGK